MTSIGEQIIATAHSYLKAPYLLGGNTVKGIDCSGLTQQAYASVGISLPRYSQDQGRYGTPTNQATARPGDLVFWKSPEHVAIYLGAGRIIQASPSSGVREDSLWGSYTFRMIYQEEVEDIMASIDDLRAVIREEVGQRVWEYLLTNTATGVTEPAGTILRSGATSAAQSVWEFRLTNTATGATEPAGTVLRTAQEGAAQGAARKVWEFGLTNTATGVTEPAGTVLRTSREGTAQDAARKVWEYELANAVTGQSKSAGSLLAGE